MEISKSHKAYLILEGIWFSIIGIATISMPIKMRASLGIIIEPGSISLLNDTRATFMLFLTIGILTFLGAFKKELTYTSTLVVTMLTLSFAVGRLLSLLVDGMPASGMVQGLFVEIVMGICGAILFMKFRINSAVAN
ncbi:MAG: DUF4345 domain-containing protein [Ignavibacteriae bacterium]|nr:DUF4345 domain-containing protein [Ignavibacteriota bacterium]